MTTFSTSLTFGYLLTTSSIGCYERHRLYDNSDGSRSTPSSRASRKLITVRRGGPTSANGGKKITLQAIEKVKNEKSWRFCGQRFAEAKIKSFTGGDKVTGRPLYGEWLDFKPVGKIVLTTNNRPEIRGSDDGIWRRIREVPFNRQFKEAEQDRELMTALRQELPGILNWAIEGCLLWQAEGLNAPASVAASITAYRSEMDTVAGFIEDECHQDPSQRSSVASLYDQYASWCKAQDKHPRTKVQFGTALKSQGYGQVRDSTGRYWKGLTTFMVT